MSRKQLEPEVAAGEDEDDDEEVRQRRGKELPGELAAEPHSFLGQRGQVRWDALLCVRYQRLAMRYYLLALVLILEVHLDHPPRNLGQLLFVVVPMVVLRPRVLLNLGREDSSMLDLQQKQWDNCSPHHRSHTCKTYGRTAWVEHGTSSSE